MPICDLGSGLQPIAEDLVRVIHASREANAVRACLLTTRDRDHALSLLKVALRECACPLYHYTLTGRRMYNQARLEWQAVGTDANDAAGLLQHAREIRNGGAVVLEDCAPFLRDEGGDARLRMQLAQMLSTETHSDGLVLVFLEAPEAERNLPSMLADQFVRMDVPYPRALELENIVRTELAVGAHRGQIPLNPDRIRHEAARLSPGLVGLTRSAARDALRDALSPNPSDLDAASERLQIRKNAHLRRALSMNVLDTHDVDEPIGLQFLMDYLSARRDKMRLYGKQRSRGVLLIGPPGTGKSMLARSIGRVVGLPVVEFRISALMNSLLGETERRFAQAFATLEAMSPNVVFIDEIEKAFGDSSERDGGTMMRVTGSLLTWLADNPNPNFIIATSNGVARMGEIGRTMTRPGRFDACFFVDLPNQDARQQMLERWLVSRMSDPMGAAADVAATTEKFSGADLFSVVKDASDAAEFDSRPVTVADLRNEADQVRMRAIAQYDQFHDLRCWARANCRPAGPGEL